MRYILLAQTTFYVGSPADSPHYPFLPPKKRGHGSPSSSPPPAKRMAGDDDVPMAETYDVYLDSPTVYKPAARGWTKALIQTSHTDDVIELLNGSPAKSMAVVILTSDFHDRGRGPGAIKAIFTAHKIPDADKIDVYPPTPKHAIAGKGMSMPWTNIVSDCSPAFKEAVLADPVYHDTYQDLPFSFYCLNNSLSPLSSRGLDKLIADPTVIQMAEADHSNVPGKDHDVKFIFNVVLHFAEVSACTVRRRNKPPIAAHRILFPPISKHPAESERLQNHIMSPSFTVDVRFRGTAIPWWGPNPSHPVAMSCSECHAVDHYNDDCPIVNSAGYRATHGIADDTASSSSVPTSLTIAHTAPSTNDWTTVPPRGGAWRGGHYRGGRGGRSRGGRGFNYGYGGRGYSPYATY
ncbi:hypothetical protein FB451DRAFT_1392372 [Mycena latifolia]|nr:hypothetical protein FB451DRAFT_1392372 [Mycena latifolia]